MKIVQYALVAMLDDFQSAGVFLEDGETGVYTRSHRRQIDANRQLKRVVLHRLGERIACFEQSVSMHGYEPEISTTIGQRPVRVVGVMVPLPLRAERSSAELVGSLGPHRRRDGCVVRYGTKGHWLTCG